MIPMYPTRNPKAHSDILKESQDSGGTIVGACPYSKNKPGVSINEGMDDNFPPNEPLENQLEYEHW